MNLSQRLKWLGTSLKTLPQALNKRDKQLVTLATLVLIVGLILGWQEYLNRTEIKPVEGGVYLEGLVNPTAIELDQLTTKLTRIGLTYVNANLEIKGGIAESYTVSNDAKTYTFNLKNGYLAQDVIDLYQGLDSFQGITMTAPSENQVVFALKQPLGLFESFVSEPIFESGPYILDKSTKTELIFKANPDSAVGKPYINKLIFTFYSDIERAKAAFQRQEIMAIDQAVSDLPRTRAYQLELNVRPALFFNLEKPALAPLAVRTKIRDKQPFETPLELTMVTSQDPEELELANRVKAELEQLNLKISLSSVNQLTLERDILAGGNYDLLIEKINFGYDLDRYPYWHSSQIIGAGKNYSGYNSKAVDQLIEKARQTADVTNRQNLINQIDKQIDQDLPALFYPEANQITTVSQRLLGRNDAKGAVSADRFSDVWLWFLRSKRAWR